ncbi:ABC transporter ATP-binding protein [Syntrophomonas palmitatica]|uniref:ABC transporter ATP-binding protein n=1 Tax=Syntrophomonas palmitatica TaxID=402877 RepID=UPI000A59DF6D|nr:Wzt carbohydrate-binding domain-containing protein [Syntrophomonas palmitatica]
MNAAIFGMTRKEIERKLDDIIEFSELGDFITSPVRTYSSGMYMRLAFAVAVNVDPDILLIDEILSVGDESFQKKCFSYMQDIKQKGCTMVIVSHSLGEIKKICDQVVWLHDGIIKINGECDFVIDQYRNQMLASADPQIKSAPEQSHYFPPDPDPSRDIVTQDIGGRTGVGVTPSRWGTGQAEIYDVTIRNSLNEIKTSFNYGEEVIIQYSYQLKDSLQDVVFGLGIFLRDGTRCYGTNTELAQLFFPLMDKGRTGKVRISMSNLYLTDGEYVVNVAIHNKDGVSFDYHHRLYAFRIVSGSNEIGIVRPHIQWQVQ